jgi:hypothetical protein
MVISDSKEREILQDVLFINYIRVEQIVSWGLITQHSLLSVYVRNACAAEVTNKAK